MKWTNLTIDDLYIGTESTLSWFQLNNDTIFFYSCCMSVLSLNHFPVITVKLLWNHLHCIKPYINKGDLTFETELLIILQKCDSWTLLCFSLFVFLFLSILLFLNPLTIGLLPSTAATVLSSFIHLFIYFFCLKQSQLFTIYEIVIVNSFSTNLAHYWSPLISFTWSLTGNGHAQNLGWVWQHHINSYHSVV